MRCQSCATLSEDEGILGQMTSCQVVLDRTNWGHAVCSGDVSLKSQLISYAWDRQLLTEGSSPVAINQAASQSNMLGTIPGGHG